MEPKGEQLFGVPTDAAGASLEVGGAHWFAQAEEQQEQEAGEDIVNGEVEIMVQAPVDALPVDALLNSCFVLC